MKNASQQITSMVNVKNSFLPLTLLGKIYWCIVILFLVVLPFRNILSERSILPPQFSYLDEVFIMIMLFLAFLALIYQGKFKVQPVYILMCLLILSIVGLISGAINNNPVVVTLNGVFDYIKNFLAIPIFCLFSIREKKIKSVYHILHKLAIFFCFVAIIQEMGFFLGYYTGGDIRFGFLRTPSLIGHPNAFGLYSLMFFIFDYSIHKKIRWQNIIFGIGIFLSISRMIWAAFFLSSIYLFLQGGNKKSIIPLIFIIIVVFATPSFFIRTSKEMRNEESFRGYTLSKSMEIWRSHPFLGVGPGRYGGVVSVTFNSPVYDKYNFSKKWYNFGLKGFHSIDQFWPQILAEMGLFGAFNFVILLFILWRIPYKAKLTAKSIFSKNMLLGFSVFPIILAVYLLGSGLNLTSILLTYSVLFGMVLGLKKENYSNK